MQAFRTSMITSKRSMAVSRAAQPTPV
jgi:hypothetical protein